MELFTGTFDGANVGVASLITQDLSEFIKEPEETKENFNTWNKLKESMSLIGQLATLIAVIQSASN